LRKLQFNKKAKTKGHLKMT